MRQIVYFIIYEKLKFIESSAKHVKYSL